MTNMLPQEHPVFPLEEQYETAAWSATIRSLATLWGEAAFETHNAAVPHIIQQIAVAAFKEPGDVYGIINKSTLVKHTYPDDLIKIGMATENRDPISKQKRPYVPASSLTLLHDIKYAEEEILRQIAAEARFERFEEDVSMLALYNRARLIDSLGQSEAFIDTLHATHHDNVFYIGKWDNDRALKISET